MSAGGINASQPLVGMQPAAQAPAAQQPTLANAAVPVSPAASTPTAYVPQAGVDAGAVGPAGGDISIPRTAAITGMVANSAAGQQSSVAGAQQAAAASGPVVDAPASLGQAGTAGTGAAGPAAWSDDWAKQMADAGLDAATIQQLNITGGMGADEAQLQQMLAQVKAEADKQLAAFEHEHPDQFRKLAAVDGLTKWVDNAGDSDRAALLKVAMASAAGQIPEEQLEQLADSAGKSQLRTAFDTFVKPMVVWSLIPGWGALRLLPAPFTGGRDILTGEKLFGDPMTTGFTILAAVGGAQTLYNNFKGAMQIAQGHRMIAAGGDAAKAAAAQGVENLSAGKKLWSYVPGTKLNQQVAGISRLDDIKAGIGQLDGIERKLAQNLYDKVVAGDVQLWGESASKWSKMGYQPNSRGFIMGHLFGKKGAASVVNDGMLPRVLLDGRTTGKVTAAQFASLGVDFADGQTKAALERIVGAIDGGDAAKLANVKSSILGTASQQLLDAGAIARPQGISKVLGALRPGAIQDSVWAADNVAAGTIGKLHGWAGLPKLAKFGIFGTAAAAGVYFLGVKPQLDAAKAAKEQQAQAAQPQAAAAGGGGAGGASSLSAEDQALLQQFAAMPAAQQQQIIGQLQAQLQQTQDPQALAAGQAELQLLVQAAGQGGAATPAATGATGAGTPVGTSGYTAEGLGLAG